jgi:hypothetical protein
LLSQPDISSANDRNLSKSLPLAALSRTIAPSVIALEEA